MTKHKQKDLKIIYLCLLIVKRRQKFRLLVFSSNNCTFSRRMRQQNSLYLGKEKDTIFTRYLALS